MIIAFWAFGCLPKGRVLLQMACLTFIWVNLRERNATIFHDRWRILKVKAGHFSLISLGFANGWFLWNSIELQLT